MKNLLVILLFLLSSAAYSGLGVNTLYEGGSGPLQDGTWIIVVLVFVAGGLLFWLIAGWLLTQLGKDDDAVFGGGIIGGIAWVVVFLSFYDQIMKAAYFFILCGIAYLVIKALFFEKK